MKLIAGDSEKVSPPHGSGEAFERISILTIYIVRFIVFRIVQHTVPLIQRRKIPLSIRDLIKRTTLSFNYCPDFARNDITRIDYRYSPACQPACPTPAASRMYEIIGARSSAARVIMRARGNASFKRGTLDASCREPGGIKADWYN